MNPSSCSFGSFIIPLHTYKKYTHLNYIKFRTVSQRLALCFVLLMSAAFSLAQNGGGKSSYSRFGLGLLNDQSLSWNRAMGGVGVAMPSGNKLNIMNPASYAYIDSLSFVFDIAMSGNFGHMSTPQNSKNVNNATLDYAVAGFRLRKDLGLSFGFKPYSTISYSYATISNSAFRDEYTGELVRNTTSYSGTGGLNQVFLGLGWKPFEGFAIGGNASLLWGGYNHAMSQGFTQGGSSTSVFDGFHFIQYADILTYKFDLGAQYAFRVSPKDWLTVGATVGLGHHFEAEDAFLYRYMSTGDTLTVDNDGGFDIPMTYAGGISWQHKNTLQVAADFHYQMWGDCNVPAMVVSNNIVSYPSTNKMYMDNYMIKAGVQYTPNPLATKGYYNKIKYRLGCSYSSPYMRIPQGEGAQMHRLDGPSELTVSMGFGLPISNSYNNRSMVNVGFQWLRRSPSSQNLITENYFVLNVGVTFNERWFMKFKIQ